MIRKILLPLSLLLIVSFAWADELDMGPGYKVPDIPPVRVTDNGREVVITLADAFEYHDGVCPGVAMAFRTIGYAFELVWGDTIPARGDIIVMSRGPMFGVLDVFNLVTRGDLKKDIDATTGATPGPPIPEGMKPGRDSFHFTVIRKSTGDAVALKADRNLYPQGFFSLRMKMKSETASKEEIKQVDSYKKSLVRRVPVMPADELFEKPERYKVIIFDK